MFSFQNRGGTTTASGLEAEADPSDEGNKLSSNTAADALTMPLDEEHPDQHHPRQQQEGEQASLARESASHHDGDEEQHGEHDSHAHYGSHYEQQLSHQHPHDGRGDDASAQQDPSAVDAASSLFPAPPTYHPQEEHDQHDQPYGEAEDRMQHYNPNEGGGEEGEDMGEAQLFTDYHGSADHAEARDRRNKQQKMYDDIPVPPDDADAHTVFAYYRKLIGLVQLVPPRHWREIRFDLPANVAELRLYPQRPERVQDREPVRPSSTVVISLDGTLPENTTPSEYAAQMVQYVLDLLQYQNASTAITALRFVKKGTELSQMVITLGRDSRLAGRILTEIQAAGLRAYYGMVIFEHPPNATFQVVDYRRTLHDGKGISAEDIAFLLEPMRVTKTVDINVIEGYEPGVFYAPVKRPEAVYAFLWNYFCSYKFQADLFRRYGVLVTQTNCPHDFLKKGIPYAVQKRELEEKIKAELLRKGFEEREGATENTAAVDGDDSEVDEEAVASGDAPAPAWVSSAADEIDIFSGLTRKGPLGKLGLQADTTHNSDKGNPTAAGSFSTPATAMAAAVPALVAEEEMADIDALLKQYNAVAEPPKKSDAAGRGRKGTDAAEKATSGPAGTGGTAQSGVPPPPPPPPLPSPSLNGPPFGDGCGYGWADARPPPPHAQHPALMNGAPYSDGQYAGPSSVHGGAGPAGYHAPFPDGQAMPYPYQQQQQQQSFYLSSAPGLNSYGGGVDRQIPPAPYRGPVGGPSPFADLVGPTSADRRGAPPNPASAYPPLVEESEDDEDVPLLDNKPQQQQHQSTPSSTAPQQHLQQQQQQQQQHPAASSPHLGGGLLSWSMEEGSSSVRGGNSSWTQSDGRGAWRDSHTQEYQQQQHPTNNHTNAFLAPSPQPAENGGESEYFEVNESGADGGAGILGDYNPSLDTPFYNAENQTNAGFDMGYPPGQQQQQQEWASQSPGMMHGSYDGNYRYGNPAENFGYQQAWEQGEGFGEGGMPYPGYELQPQQPMFTPPHVIEAAQITEDLEEHVQAAFPISWAAATAGTAAPLSLDDDEGEEEEGMSMEAAPDCVLNHVSAEEAAKDPPPPTAEMEALFLFLHRNVSLVGRLLHKTTTTTVDQAREVAPYRARVARALLIGVTASTTTTTTTADAWSAAWVQQRADGQVAASAVESTPKAEEDGAPRGEEEAAEKTNAAEAEAEADEGEVEYQLPALLPYLLRMPAGIDLAMLLALHFPRAFARRFLPYASAFLLDEHVVRVVLATALRRDARPTSPLVRAMLAHWCPLMQWLKDLVDVKAKTSAAAAASPSSSPTDTAAETSAMAAGIASTTKQLVSLVGNTMDVVLAGLSPDQREACYALSAERNYVTAFATAMQDPVSSVESEGPVSDVLLPRLWGSEGALYRSLLRLYIAADGLDAAALAKRVLSHTSPSSSLTEKEGKATAAPHVCLTRDHLYYVLTVLSRSQTAVALSRQAAAFCGTVLHLIELQQTQAGKVQDAHRAAPELGEAEATQILDAALKSLQTNEAYTALRDAYLDVEGSVTRFETILARLSSAAAPLSAAIQGDTYRAWYVNTNQQQRRNAEAAKVPSIFYYQAPSRRNTFNNAMSGGSGPRWARAPQMSATHEAGDLTVGESQASPQQPSWASAAGQWATNQRNANYNSTSSSSGRGGGASRSFSTAAQQWRVEWGERMRAYPAFGPPFTEALPEGWSSSLNRHFGRYCFAHAAPSTTTPTTASSSSSPATAAGAAGAPTYKHPGDGKEYLGTPQAFLQEPGASAEVTAMQVCERANDMHREEAVAAGLPPPAELTQADVETWLADQRHRNVFLDVATMELLNIRYRATADERSRARQAPAAGGNGGASAVGVKRGRDMNATAAAAAPPLLTVEEQQEQLLKIIPASYPAVGAPYPALFNSWSVYLNSARGQYGFSGPHHGPSQPPLFVHPVTRKHYFVSPQAFVRQRKISYDVIAREADVERVDVEKWMGDQRSRDTAIDAAVIKIVPIRYSDVEKALAANAEAVATTGEDKNGPSVDSKQSSAGKDSGNVSTARERERGGAAAAAAATAPSSSSASRHRSERGGRDGRRRSSSSSGRGGNRRRRRRRDDSDSGYDSYSEEASDDGGSYRRRGGRKGRSPRRRGGGGRRRR